MTKSNKIFTAMTAMVFISGASAATDLNSAMEESNQSPAQDAKSYDTVDELLQSNGDLRPTKNNAVPMTYGYERSKSALIRQDSDNQIADNAIVVPALNSEAITTVACPVGTSAQPNMTCLVTGNFKLDQMP